MRVLLVEDEKYMAQALEQIFQKNNYAVDLAMMVNMGLIVPCPEYMMFCIAHMLKRKIINAENPMNQGFRRCLWHPLRESNSQLTLRRSPRGAFLTPFKSLKSLDFTGFSEVSLLVNSRPISSFFS